MMMRKLLGALAMVWIALTATAAQAEWRSGISDYVEGYRWLQQAEWLAHAQVTYEACGWGRISLAPEFLDASRDDWVRVKLWDEFTRRFDEALRERRRLEAYLMTFGQPAPARTQGMFATGGCADSVKREIEGMQAR